MVPEVLAICSIVKEFLDFLPEAKSAFDSINGSGDEVPKDQVHKVIAHVAELSKAKAAGSINADHISTDHNAVSHVDTTAHNSAPHIQSAQ